MDNPQHYNLKLSEQQVQVILTGIFGDGHLTRPKTTGGNSYYITSCKHKKYLDYKAQLLNFLVGNNGVQSKINQGFKKNQIYTLSTLLHPEITIIRNNSLEQNLKLLTDLGVALWFYDDGSLHKNKQFYNLNTHTFSEDIHQDLLVPFFKNRYDINARVTTETKQDGRVFFYLRIGRHDGSFIISELLRKYYIDCFSYKLWCSETSQEWRKLQVQLKSEDKVLSNRKFTNELNKRLKSL
tara:strand:- start:429 stop:1145 length:717 start_codon:yes stop_codon:yes gene_type:complete